MDKRKLKHYEKLLLTKRKEIVEELESIKKALSDGYESGGEITSYPSHVADIGTDSSEMETLSLIITTVSQMLNDIDEALSKITDGTYGICEICGKEINPERLEFIPHTKLCIKCKEKEDNSVRGIR